MSAGVTSLLDLAGDLERRDAAVATEIDRVATLSDDARGIGRRTEAIGELLDGVPGERAAADQSMAEATDLRDAADIALATAEALCAKLEATDPATDASHDLSRAHDAARDALARVHRAAHRRATLDEAEHTARAEVVALVAQARAVAGRLAGLPRVSASGRALPEPTVGGLVEWAARVHTALLVVRSQLDVERDRLVREANELGSVVLGEQLAGNSVERVGRRVRAVLAP